jgi:hypothetical protein
MFLGDDEVNEETEAAELAAMKKQLFGNNPALLDDEEDDEEDEEHHMEFSTAEIFSKLAKKSSHVTFDVSSILYWSE